MQPAKLGKSLVHAVLNEFSVAHDTHKLLDTWHVQQVVRKMLT